VKDYNGDMQRPPDLARIELLISPDTLVWKGDSQVQFTDLWIGEDTHKLVSEKQQKSQPATEKPKAK
jgi:hypothetical protein